MAFVLLASCAAQPQERWVSATIDGQRRSDFVLVTSGSEIVGGHDSCNGWGLSDQPGLITIDLEECPQDPVRDAYWAIARGVGATRSQQGNRLVARNAEHVGVFFKVS